VRVHQKHDFDFLVGQGSGNFDIFSTELDGKPFEGFTLRLFDPQTRLWTIYWADSNAVRLDGGKFHWDKRNPGAPVWSAAFSVDEGQTWEWNWYAYFARL
jgi:hypothetical protein